MGVPYKALNIRVHTYSTRVDCVVILTPDCLTFSELELCIRELEKELESIRNEARRYFAREHGGGQLCLS